MAMNFWGIARTAGLWILIIAITGSAIIDFNKDNTVWGWFKITIAIAVIIYEIARYVTHGETISTKYKKFIIKHPFWGYLSLGLFALSLAGLILHLAVW